MCEMFQIGGGGTTDENPKPPLSEDCRSLRLRSEEETIPFQPLD